MAWHAEPEKREAALSFLLTLGICANLLELFFPAPPFLPWLKPGLANAFTMAAIYFFGPGAGLLLALLRSLIAAALSGLPVTSLTLSGAGGLVSAAAMGLLWQAFGRRGLVSLVGLGMAGAFVHTLTQLMVIYFLFVRNAYAFWQLPLLGPAAAVTGALTGLLALATVRFLEKQGPMLRAGKPDQADAVSSLIPAIKLVFLVMFSIVLFRITELRIHAALAPLILLSLLLRKRKAAPFILLRFLPLLLMTFLLNAFTEPGTLLPGFPWCTWEGLRKGGLLALRLINLITLSLHLFRLDDLLALLLMVRRRFPRLSPFVNIAVRGIGGIPAATQAFRESLSNAPKGVFNRIRHLWRAFPAMLESLIRNV
ncbi:MAG: Gx transporter family protein [Fibrobacterota bacterium]